jgi:PAS domain S-box-containing protein
LPVDPKTLLALEAAETAVVLTLGAVLWRFYRTYPREYLRWWASAAGAYGVCQVATLLLFTLDAHALIGRLLAVVMQTSALSLGFFALAGAWSLAKDRRVGRTQIVVGLMLTVGLTVVSFAFSSPTTVWGARLSPWRGGLLSAVRAVLLFWSAVLVAPIRVSLGPVGRRTIAVALVLFATAQLGYLYGPIAGALSLSVPAIYGYLGVLDIALIGVVATGIIALLLEQAQAEALGGQRQAQEALAELRAKETQFEGLIERASDIVTVLDEDATICFESPAAKRLLGWEAEEEVGRHALERVHPEDQPRVADSITRVLTRAVDEERVSYRYRHKDGSWRVLESIGREVTTAGRRRFIVNSRDVTERDELERKLLHAQKLESVGRLAGGIAHDFNNMLTVIMSNTSFAQEAVATDHPARSELDSVLDAARRAARLTAQLLAFSRQQHVTLQDIELSEHTRGMLQMLQRLVGEDVEVIADLAPELPPVRADVGQMEQVLANLVVNARDAMPRGGTLRIRTFPRCFATAETRGGEEIMPGTYVCVSVSDTGLGISPEVRAHLFEPFFTTKERGKGTGLGLATSYGIARRHNGHIWCEDAGGADGGATFVVAWPSADREQAAIEPPPRLPLSRGRERVLLVEDDQLVRASTCRILERYGYEVETAENGEDALEMLARGEPPAVVVSDVVMPRLDGPGLAAKLRAGDRELPIVFVSGYSDGYAAASAPTRRNTRYVAKPYAPEDLLGAIRSLLD